MQVTGRTDQGKKKDWKRELAHKMPKCYGLQYNQLRGGGIITHLLVGRISNSSKTMCQVIKAPRLRQARIDRYIMQSTARGEADNLDYDGNGTPRAEL